MQNPSETSHSEKTDTPKPTANTASAFLEQVQPTLRRRKFAITAITIIVLLIAGLAIWLICDVVETRRLDTTSVVLRADRATVEFGSNLHVSDFLVSLDGTLVDDVMVDTGKLGSQEVEFQYYNAKNKKRTYKFSVDVADTTKPVIYGQNSYTVNVDYDGDLTGLMLSGDYADDRPTREISGKYDLHKAGDYPLEYIITDASGNSTKQKFTLHVVKPSASSGGGSSSGGSAGGGTPISTVVDLYKNGNTSVGIDVSSWQGEVDWERVRAAGVEFAMIRVGYQAEYGGEYTLDQTFEDNITGALAVGLPVGAYYYSCVDSVDEARRQAEWVLEQVGDRPLELGVAFDWEEWNDFNRAGMSFYTLQKAADVFLGTVESAGYDGMLYGSKNYLDKFWQGNTRSVWLAQYYDRPTYGRPFQMWQLTDTGAVPGINGFVDLDVRYRP